MHGVTRQIGADAEALRPASGEAEIVIDARDAESALPDTREQLELALHLALLEEDYERAALLRDKLQKL